LNLAENPIVKGVAVLLAVAIGIRLIFELLEPVLPYLFGALIVFVVLRLIKWHRERW